MLRTAFDKKTIEDLDYSQEREFLLTSSTGEYASSAITGCHTRKYHGLLVAPQPQIDDKNHVLLSSLDETIHYKGDSHFMAFHQYPGVYHPEGYRFMVEFSANPIPKWTYIVDEVTFVKELLLLANGGGIMVRYSLIDTKEEIGLDVMPLLAFRNIHHLKKADILSEGKKFEFIDNGIRLRPDKKYSNLNIQFSKNTDFIAAPEWYYNIEYQKEKDRGYDFREDLYSPGHFSVNMKKGEQVVLLAGLEETSSKILKTRFTNELKKKAVIETFDGSLQNAAQQFIVKKDKRTEIKAGYPWFGAWGRDTFISLPGLCITTGQPKLFKEVIDSVLPELKNGLFPNIGRGEMSVYNTVDASLWFITAIQKYAAFTGTEDGIWRKYGKYMADILNNYKKGTLHHIKMDEDGLIYAGEDGLAVTWMDAIVDGKPVTPRTGKAVEINALWYNAICFCIELALFANDKKFLSEWESYPVMIKESFMKTFWDESKGYLADYVNGDYKDWSVRPNQIFAVSFHFSPVSQKYRKSIIEKVKSELLTPRGLRTLSPTDLNYIGHYEGDQKSRDRAYHQGTVWPWLIGHFAEAYLKEYGEGTIPFVEELYGGFEAALDEQCLFTIAEIYDGDYPYKAAGAVSQAWSVAELLRMKDLISKNGEGNKVKIKKEEEVSA